MARHWVKKKVATTVAGKAALKVPETEPAKVHSKVPEKVEERVLPKGKWWEKKSGRM